MGTMNAVKHGLIGALPVALSYIPLAMVFGALARATDLTLGEALGMSLMIYSGAAQLLAVQMLAGGGAFAGVLLAGTVLALRHVLMGASISRYTQSVSGRAKAAMALLLTDESFALALGRYQSAPGDHAYFLTVNAALYASWNAGTASGYLLGRSVESLAPFDLAIIFPLLFLAITVHMIKTPLERAAAAGGLVLALALRQALPGAWTILVTAIVVGLAGAGAELRSMNLRKGEEGS